MVNRFTQSGRNRRFTYYHAKVVPHVWTLTQNFQSRIFQHISVPDILKEIFADFEVKFQLQADYKPRNYCAQYQESDFDFASRLMEEEGIYYYFDHSGSMEKMIFRDNYKSPEDVPNKRDIPMYDIEMGQNETWESSISEWLIDYNLQSGKVIAWDYHSQLPKKKLDSTTTSRFNIGGNQRMEIYQHPGNYAHRYDGIDKSGSEQTSKLDSIFVDNKKTTENSMLAIDSQHKVINATSDCSSLTAGHRFNLKNHPNSDYNAAYIVISVTHEAQQSPDYLLGDGMPTPYKNGFICIPHGSGNPEYRSTLKTVQPKIHGSQTAFVVGPSGEEIFTDKYGRVKVQFHWDRDGQLDSNSSRWVRVGQTWASNRWGSMFIPRIGMEVIVNFRDGNPDKPIITGCVYNPDTMPPYELPGEKTKSGIKTNSSPGGDGFNEFRFEDKKGEEQIFVHGEKDLDVRIKNDAKELIKNDRHLLVENNQHEKVTRDKHLAVGGDKSEEVTGTTSLTTQNIQNKVKQNYALEATSEVHIKGGMNTVVESNTSLTLKVGGNFINISSGGIFVKGMMVMINSGGMAGSGSGVSPNSPEDPLEADDAVAGVEVAAKTNPPPPPPQDFTPLGGGLSNASQNGTAFVA